MPTRSMRNNNQILHRDQRRRRENAFTGSTMLPAVTKSFSDKNADVRSVYSS